ncbi:hypothetical protein DFS34DRAFT_594285 [Phlyctochytrium arcticum]|nr:hypothetical protein DFS34DRAFT_594285 [Phlyctochytrium arcticum]
MWISIPQNKGNGTLHNFSTTEATSVTSGSVILSGGLGVSKTIWANSLQAIGSSQVLPGGVASIRLTNNDNAVANIGLGGVTSTVHSDTLIRNSLYLTTPNNYVFTGDQAAGKVLIKHSADSTGFVDGALICKGGAFFEKNLSSLEMIKFGTNTCTCATAGNISANNQQSPMNVGSWSFPNGVYTPGTHCMQVPKSGVYAITAALVYDGTTPQGQYLNNSTASTLILSNRAVQAPLTYIGYLQAGTNVSWTVREKYMPECQRYRHLRI